MSITDIITQAANANGVPVSLALAQAQKESSLNPNAVNHESNGCTSYGLFQLEDCYYGVVTDPTTNANTAMGVLAGLHSQYGNWLDALDAYNEGPTAFAQGRRAGAGYASAILASAGLNPDGTPVAGAPAPGGTSAPGNTTSGGTPAQGGIDLPTVGLLVLGGLVALQALS